MTMDLLAIDLGKRSFHLHGIDADGVVVSRRVSRAKLEQTVTDLRPRTVAMEACASAHYWGQRFATRAASATNVSRVITPSSSALPAN